MDFVTALMPDGNLWTVLKSDASKLARPIKYFKELEETIDDCKFAAMLDSNDFLWCTECKNFDDEQVAFFSRPDKHIVVERIAKHNKDIAIFLLKISEDMMELKEKARKKYENLNR